MRARVSASVRTTSKRHPDGTSSSPKGGHQPSTWLAAPCLMGRASGALLPRLDGVSIEHTIAGEDPRAILLARAVTELNIANPGDWQHNVSGYLSETLRRWIAQRGGDAVRDQFSLHATLRNNPAPYSNEDIDAGRLYLAVEADAAGYVIMGPTLQALEKVHPQLPVTFYHLLTESIGRWVQVYDYQAALERVDAWKEWIEDEQNPEQYELPDVEACVPAAMHQNPLNTEEVRKLAADLKDQGPRHLIQSALDLDYTSRQFQPPVIGEESREPLMDCNPPLPALLVSFKRHDAIAGVFNEESQVWLEAEPEPAFLAEVNPSDTTSVRQAFDSLAVLCETLAAASRLMGMLPGNQEEER
jgi:hypothetical protein